jgi:hypothetical protein
MKYLVLLLSLLSVPTSGMTHDVLGLTVFNLNFVPQSRIESPPSFHNPAAGKYFKHRVEPIRETDGPLEQIIRGISLGECVLRVYSKVQLKCKRTW